MLDKKNYIALIEAMTIAYQHDMEKIHQKYAKELSDRTRQYIKEREEVMFDQSVAREAAIEEVRQRSERIAPPSEEEMRQLYRMDLAEAPDNAAVMVDGAAKWLGVTKAYIYQLTHAKEIPFHKSGNKLWFVARELRAWKNGTWKTETEILAEQYLAKHRNPFLAPKKMI